MRPPPIHTGLIDPVPIDPVPIDAVPIKARSIDTTPITASRHVAGPPVRRLRRGGHRGRRRPADQLGRRLVVAWHIAARPP
jgi:hypothetical protein